LVDFDFGGHHDGQVEGKSRHADGGPGVSSDVIAEHV
jgi:hypothetical protein